MEMLGVGLIGSPPLLGEVGCVVQVVAPNWRWFGELNSSLLGPSWPDNSFAMTDRWILVQK